MSRLIALGMAVFWVLFLLLFYASAHANPKIVYLTFDDGPSFCCTRGLLQVLRETPATFFLIGRNVVLYPGLAQEVTGNMVVGNHTMNHLYLDRLSEEILRKEIIEAQRTIWTVTGVTPKLWRAPYGHPSSLSRLVAHGLGLREVGFDVLAGDYNTEKDLGPTSKQIEEAVLNKVFPGAIILLHDGYPYTVKALPGILAGLKDRGYTVVAL